MSVVVSVLIAAALINLSCGTDASALSRHAHRHHHSPRIHHGHRPRPRIPAPTPVVGGRGQAALRFALSQLGKPYASGGNGPYSYDCSGLAQQAWRTAGVRIPRTTQQQAEIGAAVPLSQIRIGDLVIFYADASHVGIYAGDGNVVVAPHSGAFIDIEPMKWMPVYDIRRPG